MKIVQQPETDILVATSIIVSDEGQCDVLLAFGPTDGSSYPGASLVIEKTTARALARAILAEVGE